MPGVVSRLHHRSLAKTDCSCEPARLVICSGKRTPGQPQMNCGCPGFLMSNDESSPLRALYDMGDQEVNPTPFPPSLNSQRNASR